MFSIKSFSAAVCALSLAACAGTGDIGGPGGGGGGQPPVDPFARTINFVSAAGPLAIDQSFAPGAGTPGASRVCFQNNTGVTATLLHNTPGVNPMRAPAGGRSCANHPAGARVNFTLVTGDFIPMPATPDRNFVTNMAPFQNGLLSLNLRSN